MDGLTIRAATGEDVEAVMDLCRQTLDPADIFDTAGLKRLLWQDPDSGPGSRLVAEVGSDLLGCIFGSARDYGTEDGLTGFIKLVSVRLDAQRQRVGARLLASLEHELFRAGASCIWAGGSQPRYWWPGVDRANTSASSFFTRFGYEADDEVTNMCVTLTRPLPQSMTLPGTVVSRRLTPGEWPQFKIWMDQSWGSAWQEEVELTLDRNPVSCFVASENGSFIGFAAYDTNREGWFGPMGSSPQSRGKGIGQLLLNKCLDDYRAKGLTDCVIAWAGPRDFYRRTVGAEVSREFVRFRKVANITDG